MINLFFKTGVDLQAGLEPPGKKIILEI